MKSFAAVQEKNNTDQFNQSFFTKVYVSYGDSQVLFDLKL